MIVCAAASVAVLWLLPALEAAATVLLGGRRRTGWPGFPQPPGWVVISRYLLVWLAPGLMLWPIVAA